MAEKLIRETQVDLSRINQEIEYTNTRIDGLGKVFNYKGRVDSVDNLPSSGNKEGDLYLVGLSTDPDKAEYFWDGGKWEYLGNTSNQNYATTDTSGIVELATKDEALAGVDATKAITPYTLKAITDKKADLVDGSVPVDQIPSLPYLPTSGGRVNGNVIIESTAPVLSIKTSGYQSVLSLDNSPKYDGDGSGKYNIGCLEKQLLIYRGDRGTTNSIRIDLDGNLERVKNGKAYEYLTLENKAVPNGVASLDSSGKVPTGQIPSLPYLPTSGGTVNGKITLNLLEATSLALGTGKNACYISTSGNLLLDNRNNTITGPTIIRYANNSYSEKVLWSSDKAVPNGVASLGSDGKVPNEQLPDALTNAVAKTGDTMTGALKVPTPASTTNDTTVPTTEWVRSYGVNKSGDTMTGALKAPTPGTDSNDTTVVTSAWVRNLLEQEKTKLMGIPNTKAGVAFSVECGNSGSGTQYNVPANGIIVINASYASGNHDDIPVLLINGNNVGNPNTTASHIHMVLSGDTIGTSNASDGYSVNAIKGIFFPYL